MTSKASNSKPLIRKLDKGPYRCRQKAGACQTVHPNNFQDFNIDYNETRHT